MKFSLVILLLSAVVLVNTQSFDICFVCAGFIQIPKDWTGARSLLSMGCGQLGEAEEACNLLLKVTDLTSSYPNMYPHIIQLKEIGCKYYCHV